jgi:hypothetical protein
MAAVAETSVGLLPIRGARTASVVETGAETEPTSETRTVTGALASTDGTPVGPSPFRDARTDPVAGIGVAAGAASGIGSVVGVQSVAVAGIPAESLVEGWARVGVVVVSMAGFRCSG